MCASGVVLRQLFVLNWNRSRMSAAEVSGMNGGIKFRHWLDRVHLRTDAQKMPKQDNGHQQHAGELVSKTQHMVHVQCYPCLGWMAIHF